MSGSDGSRVTQSKDHIELYCRCISEMKWRSDFIRESWVTPATNTDRSVLYLEGACLQLRTIIELIAFASLVSSQEAYSREWSNYARANDFTKLIKSLRAINPHFLPTGVKFLGRDASGSLQMRDADVQLDEDILVSAHGRMGNVVHAQNPFKPRMDYEQHRVILASTMNHLIAAMQNHVAILSDGTHLLIQMGANDELIRPTVLREAIA